MNAIELTCHWAITKAADGSKVLIACQPGNVSRIVKRIAELKFVATVCESGVMVTAPGVSTELAVIKQYVENQKNV
jgi:hypothetical protein